MCSLVWSSEIAWVAMSVVTWVRPWDPRLAALSAMVEVRASASQLASLWGKQLGWVVVELGPSSDQKLGCVSDLKFSVGWESTLVWTWALMSVAALAFLSLRWGFPWARLLAAP